jgi:hypothetical protein
MAWWWGRGPERSGPGLPFRGRAGGRGGGGTTRRRRVRSARFLSLRCSRAAAGLREPRSPGRGAACPHLPVATAARAAAPGPPASQRMAPAAGLAGYAGCSGAQWQRWRGRREHPARGKDPPAAGCVRSPRLGPGRSERESKTRARAVSPGQFRPHGPRSCARRACAGGSERAGPRAVAAAGRKAAGGDPAAGGTSAGAAGASCQSHRGAPATTRGTTWE